MKKMKYSKVLVGALFAAAALTWTACTDTWDDHYEGKAAGHNGLSLWNNIASDARLAPFAKVLRATGYEAQLQSPQMLTVWAPTITDEEADQLIAAYQAEKKEGVKDDDNSVIMQFVKNHIALYNTSVSSYTSDSIRMLNGKYMVLKPDALNETAFLEKNIISTNGVLYKVGNKLAFYPNLWEKIQQLPELSQMTAFLKSHNEYELDEEASVPGGVVDGMTVYLDSVMYMRNMMFSAYGYINREDSAYILLGVTNPVWDNLYAKYKGYYNYSTDYAADYRDSLMHTYASQSILQSLFFNKNLQKAPQDSLVTTQYSSYLPGVDVFKNPFSADDEDGDGYPGILSGLEKQTCSNGDLYVAAENRVNTHLTSVFSPAYLEGEWKSYAEVEKDSKGEDKMTMSILSTKNSVDVGEKHYDFRVGNNSYLEVKAVGNTDAKIVYTMPNTYSNVYYNIYAVMAPVIAYDENALPEDTLPVKFRAKFLRTDIAGKMQTEREAKWITVPTGVNKDGNTEFVSMPNKLDTICLARAFDPLAVSGYGLQNGNLKLVMETNVSSRENRKTYTRVFRIDRIVWVPYDTKEEAEQERYK